MVELCGFLGCAQALTIVVKKSDDDYGSHTCCDQKSCQEECDLEQRPLETIQLPREGHERHVGIHFRDKSGCRTYAVTIITGPCDLELIREHPYALECRSQGILLATRGGKNHPAAFPKKAHPNGVCQPIDFSGQVSLEPDLPKQLDS